MILHLLFDEKFSDYVIEQFQKPEMQSDFVLVSNTNQMRYFTRLDAVYIINPNKVDEMDQLLKNISNYNSVVFHGLFHPWQEWLLNHWPENVKIAWVCWGGEVYGQPDMRTKFLKPFSKLLYYLHSIRHHQKKDEYIFPKLLLNKPDYCLTSIEAEYEYVKKHINNNIKHLRYSYYSIDETLGGLKECRCSGNNIFIGNSATIENNHVETLLTLSRLKFGNRKVVIPLSYGTSWVRNMCLTIGYKLFGERLEPLLNFMPRDQYNAQMLDCCVMIQNHLREQAHGNIVTGLWLGMRVYLSERGIDYQRFKLIGCKVYSIEKDLKPNNADALLPMSEEDVNYNRQILINNYGKNYMSQVISKTFNVLNE